MSAVGRALQFDDNELPFAIDAEEVNPAVGALEIPELLGDDMEVLVNEIDVVSKCRLKMRPLLDVLLGEAAALELDQGVLGDQGVALDSGHVVQRHAFSSADRSKAGPARASPHHHALSSMMRPRFKESPSRRRLEEWRSAGSALRRAPIWRAAAR